jgi:enoyl-CoA hydratase/carnithine racemase
VSDSTELNSVEPWDEELTFEIQNDIAVITINRPDVGNALSSSLLRKLANTLDKLKANRSARCAILKGAGTRATLNLQKTNEQGIPGWRRKRDSNHPTRFVCGDPWVLVVLT